MSTAGDKAALAFSTINDNFAYLDNRIDGISGTLKYYVGTSPALTPTSGKVSWTVTHNLGTSNVIAILYYGGNEIVKNISIDSANAITVVFSASTSTTARDYTLMIMGA